MITALCLNPSFDKTVHVHSLRVGEVNRTVSVQTSVGGKGVNVSRVLNALGVQARCLGFLGRESRRRYEEYLAGEKLPCAWLDVDGEVRVNTKIVDDDSTAVTELNETGPVISEHAQAVFLEMLGQKAEGSEICVMSGSLGPGLPTDYYRRCMEALPSVPCVVDTAGKPLLDTLEMRPFLIKPNLRELEELSGRELFGQGEILAAARQLTARGARNVLVSLGKEGAMLLTADKCFYASAVPVRVKDPVGAGDTMVGGFLSAVCRGEGFKEALRRSVAAATASILLDGTAIPRKEQCDEILDRVLVREL